MKNHFNYIKVLAEKTRNQGDILQREKITYFVFFQKKHEIKVF